MWQNRIRRRLAAGLPAYGPILRLPGPAGVEWAARAGFDFVFIDLEHGALDVSIVEQMAALAAANGISPLVRTPDDRSAALSRLLDVGAHGVIVPMVCTEKAARQIGDATKHAPLGTRGTGGPLRGNGWGAMDMAAVNNEVLTVVQIETAAAVEQADAIARQPGVDLLFIGPFDLTHSLGIAGQLDHPTFLAATERVIAAARKHGKWVGIFVPRAADASFWHQRGVHMIACGLDSMLLQQGLAQMAAGLGIRP